MSNELKPFRMKYLPHRILARNIRSFRMQKHISQRELGERSGVGVHTIYEIENGNNPGVMLTTIVALASILHAAPHVLLDPETPQYTGHYNKAYPNYRKPCRLIVLPENPL